MVFEFKLTSASTWSTLCTVNASPWTCTFDTNTLANASYDFRARSTDALGNATTTATQSRTVANPLPGGFDVQAVPSGNVRVSSGDAITFTYLTPMDVSTIFTSGTTTVRLTGGAQNTLSFPGTNLGTLDVARYLTAAGSTLDFPATISASTVSNRTVVTVTLTGNNNGAQANSSLSYQMKWTPSAAAKDLAGRASATTVVSESGALDADF